MVEGRRTVFSPVLGRTARQKGNLLAGPSGPELAERLNASETADTVRVLPAEATRAEQTADPLSASHNQRTYGIRGNIIKLVTTSGAAQHRLQPTRRPTGSLVATGMLARPSPSCTASRPASLANITSAARLQFRGGDSEASGRTWATG